MTKRTLGGILILVFIGSLFTAVVALRHIPSGMTFTIELEEAKGLEAGDFIYLKGVRVGEIHSVSLENGRVATIASIYKESDIQIPTDSFLFVWHDQLVTGKQCIIIRSGTSAEVLQAGAKTRGESDKIKIAWKIGREELVKLFE